MLEPLVRRLDEWVRVENIERLASGGLLLRPCCIRLFGQAALFEQALDLPLVATRDVDVIGDYEFAVEREFRRLLAESGLDLDPLAREAWMPPETEYTPVFVGSFVRLEVADAAAILVSKGLYAPAKNAPLLVDYLARTPSARFFALAEKYGLDWEQFA